jgi:spermidine/putrescine transport system ATP-binding protein
VISDLSLTINDGEFLTLLGPSGCGKTTVLRLIAGLENVDNGLIHLENQDITQVPAENRHVNTVFQSYALFPHMTVFENVAFGLRMQKTPAKDIPRALPKHCVWFSWRSLLSVTPPAFRRPATACGHRACRGQ